MYCPVPQDTRPATRFSKDWIIPVASIEADRAYPDEARYWTMVQQTMVMVFHKPDEEAAGLVTAFVRTMADASPQERLLSFHAEPFEVAASLLRVDGSGSDVQHRSYRSLASRMGWERPMPDDRPPAVSYGHQMT